MADMGANPLDNVSIVLVEPQGPLNVGASARAMKNMGLSSMIVVGDMDLTSDACRLMAPGSKEILEAAQQVATIEEALSQATFVVGTTARGRHRRATETPAEVSPTILEMAVHGKVAILFGREDSGLSKHEIALCHRVISVPTDGDRASLNLAQAVLLVCYEIFQRSKAEKVVANAELGDLLVGSDWDRLYHEMLLCCAETGYMSAGNKLAIEESFKRLLKLGPMQTRDSRHLFGLVRRVAKMIDGRVEANPSQNFIPPARKPKEGND